MVLLAASKLAGTMKVCKTFDHVCRLVRFHCLLVLAQASEGPDTLTRLAALEMVRTASQKEAQLAKVALSSDRLNLGASAVLDSHISAVFFFCVQFFCRVTAMHRSGSDSTERAGKVQALATRRTCRCRFKAF